MYLNLPCFRVTKAPSHFIGQNDEIEEIENIKRNVLTFFSKQRVNIHRDHHYALVQAAK